jgi:hypothetical protein
MARTLEARLKRLEAEAQRPPLTYIVRWADDDEAPTAGPVIRLHWADNREQEEA